MKHVFIFVTLFCFFLPLPATLSAEEGGADAIVAEMDRRMNFSECTMVVRIEDRKADGRTRSLQARIEYLKGVGTRMDFEEPPRERGKKVLLSGTSLWMSAPAVSKAVRLSGKDAFMGTTFTNDDLMNLDKSDDYDSTIVSEDAEGWKIEMKARSPSLAYPRIEAFVGRDYLPRSMVFFARSGRESKRISFTEPRVFGGRSRPSVMTIVDLMKPGDSSSVIFVDIREGKVDRARLLPSALGG